MTNLKKKYFVSDLHLGLPSYEKSLEREKLFVAWLDEIKSDAGEIYLLGDIFDFWFEYKHAIPAAYLRTLAALVSLTGAGVRVIYLPGNHDFWMGDYLARQAGIDIAGEKLEIMHQGKKIHLYHGDGLAYGDSGYRIIKRIFRFKPNIWLFRLLPVDLAYRLAHGTSGASRQHTTAKDKDLKGYYDYGAKKIAEGCDAVIMGHTHLPEIRQMAAGHYINTGDWIDNNSYVILADGLFRLAYWGKNDL